MTPFIKKKEVKKDWYIINAKDIAVGDEPDYSETAIKEEIAVEEAATPESAVEEETNAEEAAKTEEVPSTDKTKSEDAATELEETKE